MAIDWQPAPPVAPGNLPEYYSNVVSFQTERNQRTIRNNRIAWSLVAALTVANLGQMAPSSLCCRWCGWCPI